jgi:hypothetical protein
MNDGPEWFAPKRYGIGAGLPIRWQGWAITILFLAYAFAVSLWFKDDKLVTVTLMAPAIVLFLTVVAKTTRGGWRWRWGGEDED